MVNDWTNKKVKAGVYFTENYHTNHVLVGRYLFDKTMMSQI